MITGRRAAPELLAPKLLWLKTHAPDIAGRIQSVIGLKDEMVRRLTGVVSTNVTHANYGMFFDVANGRFDRGTDSGIRFGPKAASSRACLFRSCGRGGVQRRRRCNGNSSRNAGCLRQHGRNNGHVWWGTQPGEKSGACVWNHRRADDARFCLAG